MNTIEVLRKEREELQAQALSLRDQSHQVMGAMQVIDILIKKLESTNGTESKHGAS